MSVLHTTRFVKGPSSQPDGLEESRASSSQEREVPGLSEVHELTVAFPEGQQELGTDPLPSMRQESCSVRDLPATCYTRLWSCGGDPYRARARSSHTASGSLMVLGYTRA